MLYEIQIPYEKDTPNKVLNRDALFLGDFL